MKLNQVWKELLWCLLLIPFLKPLGTSHFPSSGGQLSGFHLFMLKMVNAKTQIIPPPILFPGSAVALQAEVFL